MKEKKEYKFKYNYPFNAKVKQEALLDLKIHSKYYVANKYKITIKTIYEWKKKYDGSLKSLENKSHARLSIDKKEMTKEEKDLVVKMFNNNKNKGLNEIYGILKRQYEFKRNYITLYRYLKKNELIGKVKHKKIVLPYDTPEEVGKKWQIDVKVVPTKCLNFETNKNIHLYQYTCIDEAIRQRFLYGYDKQCAESTVDFVLRCIDFYNYVPYEIQTDNGQEFTYLVKTNKVHLLDQLCQQLGIYHHRIKPRTPKHNGKVERSHLNDQRMFYKFEIFTSLEDFQTKLKEYLDRSNNIPSRILNWFSPNEKRKELELSGKVYIRV